MNTETQKPSASRFQRFARSIREADCTVKIFYSDQGGDFEGMDDYLRECGIYL